MGIRLGIVGGGASGMMAAITAARAGAQVVILEQKPSVGKKLLATGNGHCNFTNAYMEPDCFHGNSWAMEVIRGFDLSNTLDFFQELGIFPVERKGYYYPASEQAASVVALLLEELKRLQVRVVTEAQVKRITPLEPGFRVEYIQTIALPAVDAHSVDAGRNKKDKMKKRKPAITTTREQLLVDKVILACGGKAASKLGSDGSGYYLAGLLGHGLVDPLPALTGIRCAEPWFQELAGIRVAAKVALWDTTKEVDSLITSVEGELQLTEYGISGIPVFQLSRWVSRGLAEGRTYRIGLTFHPEIAKEAYEAYLQSHDETQYRGLYPEALLAVLTREQAVLSRTLWCTPEGVNDFEKAQVTTGGIPLAEVDRQTMESKLVKGLYMTGELLDVDGICGGYNLQWAWSSGYRGGLCAATME